MKGSLAALVAFIVIASGCLNEPASETESSKEVAKGGGRGKSLGAPAAVTYVAQLPDGSLADPVRLAGVPNIVGAQRFIGGESYEPTLFINQQTGSIFMSGLSFGGPGSAGGNPVSSVYRSQDQGVTWQDMFPMLPAGDLKNPPATGDPFIFGDPITGRVFTGDLSPPLVCNWLSWSDDEAESWETNPAGCGAPVGVHDHQSLITGVPRMTPTVGYENMVYYCVNRVGDSSCASSLDGGRSFGPLVTVMLGADVEAGGFCGGLHGHVKTDNAGRVFLPKGQCGVPSVGVSEDDGKTWTTYRISRATGIRGHEVSIAADKADNLYAFWIGSNGLPYLSTSVDHAQTWTTPRNVAPPGVTATEWPSIFAMDDGKIAFVYVGTTHPKGFANQNATAWVGATWNGYLGIMTDALAPDALVFTTTVNDPADPIAINQCGGTRCQGLYDFIDIDIDPSGRPWAALVDVCHAKCIADFAKDPASARHDPAAGFMGTLVTGPSLLASGEALATLPDYVQPTLPTADPG